jgi:AraC family transcriptional regulator, arabinose operon regulatory protein
MDERITAIIAAMKSDIGRKRSVRTLAWSCGLSLSRFCHLFKEETGSSPAQYVKQLRMHEAYRLLRDSSLALKKILYQAGFGDRSHFSRDFKRIHGISPAHLRRGTASKDDPPPRRYRPRQAAKIATSPARTATSKE